MLWSIHEEGYIYGNLCLDNIVAIRKKFNGINYGRVTIQDLTQCIKYKTVLEKSKEKKGTTTDKKNDKDKQLIKYRLTAFSSMQ
jgi:hypothetical protein